MPGLAGSLKMLRLSALDHDACYRATSFMQSWIVSANIEVWLKRDRPQPPNVYGDSHEIRPCFVVKLAQASRNAAAWCYVKRLSFAAIMALTLRECGISSA